MIELTKQGLRCDSQKQFPVQYEGEPIGILIPDLIVEDQVIVDPKVCTAFNDTHRSDARLPKYHWSKNRSAPQL